MTTSTTTSRSRKSLASYFRKVIDQKDICLRPSIFTGSTRLHHENCSVPKLRLLVKEFIDEHDKLTYQDWIETLDDLYMSSSNFEDVCCAGYLFGHYNTYRMKMPIPRLERWLSNLNGWCEIDTTCQSHFTSQEILERPEYYDYLSQWSTDSNMNLRRASLVILQAPLRTCDDPQLLDMLIANIDRQPNKEHKLIAPAISWGLRTAIKHFRERATEYVDKNQDTLPRLAVREFRTKLRKGTKV